MDSQRQPLPEEFVVVLVTVPSEDVAVKLANALVSEKLAACVNILPSVRSIYSWQGTVCDDSELLCVLKSRRTLFAALRNRVLALHPYDVPEIIALPLADGDGAYLTWLRAETSPPRPETIPPEDQ
jgi:periplasmic divalent cation tolerance protein